MMNNRQPYHPPFRFSIVEEGLYRGSYPKERNFSYLKRLKLKTILSLIPSSPTPALLGFSAQHCIHNVHISINKPKENIPLTFSQITKLLNIILDQRNLPMYVHCLDGTIVTGIVVACLRKLQCWTSSMALIEYARFLSDDGNALPSAEETEFVEKYQTDLELHTNRVPSWVFLTTARFSKHPTLKIKWIADESISAQQQQQQKTGSSLSSYSRQYFTKDGAIHQEILSDGLSFSHHPQQRYHSTQSSLSEIDAFMQSSSDTQTYSPCLPNSSSVLNPSRFLTHTSSGASIPLESSQNNTMNSHLAHQTQQQSQKPSFSHPSSSGTSSNGMTTGEPIMPTPGVGLNLNTSFASTSLSAALKAEKEQLRQRHIDLGLSMTRRDNLMRKEFSTIANPNDSSGLGSPHYASPNVSVVHNGNPTTAIGSNSTGVFNSISGTSTNTFGHPAYSGMSGKRLIVEQQKVYGQNFNVNLNNTVMMEGSMSATAESTDMTSDSLEDLQEPSLTLQALALESPYTNSSHLRR